MLCFFVKNESNSSNNNSLFLIHYLSLPASVESRTVLLSSINSNNSRRRKPKSPAFFRRSERKDVKMASQVTTRTEPIEDRVSSVPFRQGIDVILSTVRSRIADTHKGVSSIRPFHRSDGQVVTLVDIGWLKTHEEVIKDRVRNLKEAIKEWNEYRMPLLVDSKSGAILDGHHRYHVGRQLGLSRLPVVLVDYLDDDTIDVDVWPECGLDCLSKEDVIEMSLSNKVFPPKTSKHGFVNEMSPINIPLAQLI